MWIFYRFIRCIPCADGVFSVEIIEIWRFGLLDSTDHHVLYTVMYFFYQRSGISIRIISARYLYLEKNGVFGKGRNFHISRFPHGML